MKLPFESGPYGTASLEFDELRRSMPVCKAEVPSGWQTWLVTRYGDVASVLKDPVFSRDAAVRAGAVLVENTGVELEPGVLQNMDGPPHRLLRELFGQLYGPGHDAEWTEVIRREANAVVDELQPATGRELDFHADLFDPIATRCAEQLFGFPSYGRDVLGNFFDREANAQLRRDVAVMFDDPTRRSQGKLFEVLAGATADGSADRQVLIDNVLIIVTATFQAVAAPFLGGIFALLRDRPQWNACVVDPSLRPNAVEEMLRMFPNGDLQFLRVALEDRVVSGVEIARGDAILAPVAAGNTDPDVFANPRRFDCRRANSQKHIAFGVGKHFCLGGLLSKAWMRAVFDVVLERLPGLTLAVAPDQIVYRSHPLITIFEALPVRVRERESE